jgi:hypothetical protein
MKNQFGSNHEVCHSSCDGLSGAFNFKFDIQTPSATDDDQIVCVPQCPPQAADVTTGFNFDGKTFDANLGS